MYGYLVVGSGLYGAVFAHEVKEAGNEILDIPNFQGNAAVNYTDREPQWTRIIEYCITDSYAEGIMLTIKWYKDHMDWMNECTSGEYTKYYEELYRKR